MLRSATLIDLIEDIKSLLVESESDPDASSAFLRMTPQELKFFSGTDFEGPRDKDFKKIVLRINAIPMEQLHKAWGAKNAAEAKKDIKSKAKQSFKRWLLYSSKLSPKMRAIVTTYPGSAPIIYYVFMRRMLGRKEAFKLFKRFFKSDQDKYGYGDEVTDEVSDTPDTVSTPAAKPAEAPKRQKNSRWSKPNKKTTAHVSDETEKVLNGKPNEKRVVKPTKTAVMAKQETVSQSLKDRIADKLPNPPDFEAQVEIARELRGRHQGSLPTKLSELKSMAPEGASVKGRVKELESAVEKVARKPKYGTAKGLQDMTGARLIMDTIDQVKRTVNNIKAKYTIVEEDDYIESAKDGYRSHHLIARDAEGLEFEIQVRTQNQNTWAEWAHPMYKLMESVRVGTLSGKESPEQIKAIEQHEQEINDYKLKMSAYFYSLDDESIEPIAKPECPPYIDLPFGCQ